MSLKKIAFVSAIGLTIGILGSIFYQNIPNRRLASEHPAPKIKIKPWAESLSGKTHQAIQVQIAAVGGVPDHDNQDLRLKATVTLNRALDQELKWQWSLPPGADVVSGELEDAWPNLQPGQTASTEITITGVSKESVAKTVTLHVSGMSHGVQYASSGSFATNSPEQMLASETPGNMKVQNQELVLKKTGSAEKLNKLHQ